MAKVGDDLFAGDAGGDVGDDLREDDVEDGVRARRLAVHVGGGDGARLVALGHQTGDVLVRLDGQLRQSVDVRAEHRVLAHLQRRLHLLARVQQVVHLLVVDLQVAHLHLPLKKQRTPAR